VREYSLKQKRFGFGQTFLMLCQYNCIILSIIQGYGDKVSALITQNTYLIDTRTKIKTLLFLLFIPFVYKQ
jgi:hypothetical protein